MGVRAADPTAVTDLWGWTIVSVASVATGPGLRAIVAPRPAADEPARAGTIRPYPAVSKSFWAVQGKPGAWR